MHILLKWNICKISSSSNVTSNFMSKSIIPNLKGFRYLSTNLHSFVPKHNPVQDNDINALRQFIEDSQDLVILTGAGISTESGIPDYRSEGVGLYAKSNHKPVQYQDFLKSSLIRQRYWARNYIGWSRFSSVQPNSVHRSIRNLELDHNKVSTVITQNVDCLHFKAGSKNIIELHGTAFRVICLECGAEYNRHYIQEKLTELNPHMQSTSDIIRPDGDVEISQEIIKNFQPPFCDSCGGILKPDIVFFGDNVPKSRVEAVRNAVSKGDSLLILGSTLSVFSGYRIILQALEENKSMAMVNIGPTRADKHIKLKISAKCGDILPKIC